MVFFVCFIYEELDVFFLFLYIHIGRGLYYFSFKKFWTWTTGIIIYIASMATAFLGYVLPWGQMSYWGATVITNFLSVVPFIGEKLVIFIWGSFSVDSPTLNRFFSLHFFLPFVLVFLILLHLIFLHEVGSKKPLGLSSLGDKINFHKIFSFKDFMGFRFLFSIFLVFFYSQNLLWNIKIF